MFDLLMMQSAARKIIEEQLKSSVISLTRLTGDQNAVFRADTAQSRYIVRISRDGCDTYRKEEWVMARAAEVGVMVPKVLAVGVQGDIPYMVMEWIEGMRGSDYTDDRKALYATLGDYARRLATIPISGYGWDFDLHPQPHFTRTWRQAVEKDEAYILGGDTLAKLNILNAPQIDTVRSFMHDYAAWDLPPCLAHNDICLDNVIIGDDEKIYLIDWSNACAQPAPMFEIARIGSNVPDDLLEAFITGYGIGAAEWDQIAPTVQKLKLVHALRALVWAAQDAPAYLEEFSNTVRRLTEKHSI